VQYGVPRQPRWTQSTHEIESALRARGGARIAFDRVLAFLLFLIIVNGEFWALRVLQTEDTSYFTATSVWISIGGEVFLIAGSRLVIAGSGGRASQGQ
jgi:hypothetical protein